MFIPLFEHNICFCRCIFKMLIWPCLWLKLLIAVLTVESAYILKNKHYFNVSFFTYVAFTLHMTIDVVS